MPKTIIDRFWEMTNEKGVGSDVRYAQACAQFLTSALAELGRETMARIDEQEKACDASHPNDSHGCVNGVRSRVRSFLLGKGIDVDV